MAETLLEIVGAPNEPAKLSESALVIIDAQREYLDGRLPLKGYEFALDEIKKLLERARAMAIPVWFVRHFSPGGAPIFDPNGKYVELVDGLAPKGANEMVLDKHHPSAFVETNFDTQLKAAQVKQLIVTGFMSHCCVSATVRQASALGYPVTVVADACATRDLPSTDGGTVPAQDLHRATMAALSDIFAVVVPSQVDLPD